MAVSIAASTDGGVKHSWIQVTESGVANDRNLLLNPLGGYVVLHVPTSPIADAALDLSQLSFSVNEGTNQLILKLKLAAAL